jgi:hypothetical protein
MDMESMNYMMEQDMKEIGKMISKMDLEEKHGRIFLIIFI